MQRMTEKQILESTNKFCIQQSKEVEQFYYKTLPTKYNIDEVKINGYENKTVDEIMISKSGKPIKETDLEADSLVDDLAGVEVM